MCPVSVRPDSGVVLLRPLCLAWLAASRASAAGTHQASTDTRQGNGGAAGANHLGGSQHAHGALLDGEGRLLVHSQRAGSDLCTDAAGDGAGAAAKDGCLRGSEQVDLAEST